MDEETEKRPPYFPSGVKGPVNAEIRRDGEQDMRQTACPTRAAKGSNLLENPALCVNGPSTYMINESHVYARRHVS